MAGREVIAKILDEVSKFVVGKPDLLKLMAVALLSEGHILIEGPAGVGKTLLARTFALAIGGVFKRVQMTPDLLPGDIIGTVFYDLRASEWRLRKGPVFSNILLVDELNRAPPKTQAALLEAMQERRVSIEGRTLPLPRPFLVIATQVPYGGEGTYPLTDVQIDRFAFRTYTGYPDPQDEIEVLNRVDEIESLDVRQVATVEEVSKLVNEVKRVYVSGRIKEYIVSMVSRLRGYDEVLSGPSPRASIWLLKGARALAYLEGRSYVLPDDVKALALYVLTHRIKIKPEYAMEGVKPDHLVERVLKEVEVPKR